VQELRRGAARLCRHHGDEHRRRPSEHHRSGPPLPVRRVRPLTAAL